MSTITRAADALPVSGADMNAEPVTDQLNYILTWAEGHNVDEDNVNLTATNGITGKSTAQTITGLKTFENTSIGAGGLRTVLNISQNPSSGTSTDADGISIPFLGDDDAGTQVTYARLDILFDDTGAASMDSSWNFRLVQAGTAREVLSLGSTETTFNEDAQDIDFRLESDTNANALTVDAGLFSGVGGIGLGAAATTAGAVLIDPPAFTAAAATNIARLNIENTAAITVPAGTTAIAASVFLGEPNLTATGTITSAVTLYIEDAPTEGGTNNYSLWIDAGNVRLDGALILNDGTYNNPLRIGSVRVWYDSANTTLRVKHGSDPVSASDGNPLMEG